MRTFLLALPLIVACGSVSTPGPARDVLPTLVKAGGDLPAIAGSVEVQGRLVDHEGALCIKLRDGALIELKLDDRAPWDAVLERRLIATGVATPVRATSESAPVGRLAVKGPPVLEPGNPDGFTRPPPEDFADTLPEGVSLLHPPIRGPIGPYRPVTLLVGSAGPMEPIDAWAVGAHGVAHLQVEPRHALDDLRDVVPFDVDSDGQLEVVLLADWMTGIGPEGAVPFAQPAVLAWDGSALVQRTETDERLAGVSTRRALAEALGADPGVLPSADLLRVLALAEACGKRNGGTGRGGTPLVYGPGAVLVPDGDAWLVTISEEALDATPQGAAFHVDPLSGTCDGEAIEANTAGAPVDAASVLAAAVECAGRDHDGRGHTGSQLMLDTPVLTWNGPGKPWRVTYEERAPTRRPSGLQLEIGADGTCTAVPME